MFTKQAIMALVCCMLSYIMHAQKIVAGEYFFDIDPGVGHGKPITINNPLDSIHIIASVSTNSLQPGAHTVSVRTKASDGNWSLFETRSFYISQGSNNGLLNVTAAEYFFNTDPGIGKGKKLTIATPSDSIHINDSITVDSSLAPGSHTVSVRTKTSNGKWSLFDTRSFYISQGSNNGLLNITAAEYFFDADPGIGKGKKLTIGTPSDSIHIDGSITVDSSLAPGSHTVSVRTKTSNGKWSLFDTRSFYISQGSNNGLLNITAAEYFFDNDPGLGKAIPLNIGVENDSIYITDSISDTYLPGKDHFLCVRVKTSNGKWGIYESRILSFKSLNRDRDGLIDWEEPAYSTDPLNFDTNGDGLTDGVNVFIGTNPTKKDFDGDGISNLQEILNGTSPILKDTDGDGVPDNKDPFPRDRFRSKLPPKNLSDHTKPVIILKEPF